MASTPHFSWDKTLTRRPRTFARFGGESHRALRQSAQSHVCPRTASPDARSAHRPRPVPRHTSAPSRTMSRAFLSNRSPTNVGVPQPAVLRPLDKPDLGHELAGEIGSSRYGALGTTGVRFILRVSYRITVQFKITISEATAVRRRPRLERPLSGKYRGPKRWTICSWSVRFDKRRCSDIGTNADNSNVNHPAPPRIPPTPGKPPRASTAARTQIRN